MNPLSAQILHAAGLALTLAACAGCNDSPFAFATVSGTVTLDGQPVPDAWVIFMPQASGADSLAGPHSKAQTDAGGRFDLRTLEKSPHRGAVVGTHKIIVSTLRSERDPNNEDRDIVIAEESIPRIYTDRRETPLRFEVPAAGTDSANLELTSAPPR